MNRPVTLMLSLFLAAFTQACFHQNDKTRGDGNTLVISEYRLNDTGVDQYIEEVTNADSTISYQYATQSPSDMPGQDASSGRDVDNLDNSDGTLGFSLSKLDQNGTPLSDQQANYYTTPWSCVFDKTTGMYWEVKTTDGVQDYRNRYTWYSTDTLTNGGNAGAVGQSEICQGSLTYCNTETYVATINAMKLCGFSDWRLPTREELRSIVNYGVGDGSAMIDKNYFPNTDNTDHWTSQTALYASEDGAKAWEMHFDLGYSEAHEKSSTSVTVRLVRRPE